MNKTEQYRAGEREIARTKDLLRILPKGRASVLDIGARDGHFSRLLTEYFSEVTALDLKKPEFTIPGVVTVEGDATGLGFADESFDCVFCAEVLEHIPDLRLACSEISRVARHEIIIGVPFEQDTRVGRTTCRSCGKPNPPWGHVNVFTERRIQEMFPGLRIISKSFVGSSADATNSLSTFLMDLAGNPWGSYDQDEPCVHCGKTLVAPEKSQPWQKMCAVAAHRINAIQSRLTRAHGNWIHLVLSKQKGP